MNNFNPLVSIIIPVYNGSNYVREAIDSALAQTYKNIEIIVINDGSTDNTEKIVKSYGSKLRYFKKENGGVATALNLGIQKSKGEYISWLSHDDVYYPDKILKQIECMSLNKSLDIIFGNVEFIDNSSKTISRTEHEKNHEIKKITLGVYSVMNGLVNGCVILVKKKCYENVGLFDESLKTSNDYDMWFKIFRKYKVEFIPDILIKYRLHDKQGTKVSSVFIDESNKLWIGMFKSLKNEEILKFDRSIKSFYLRMAEQMKDAKYIDAYKYALKLADEDKSKRKPMLTVVMPCYNTVKYVSAAINSVLNQTFNDFELIIIDDASTDGCMDKIEKYKNKDKRIKVIRNNKNLGIAMTMNKGLKIAKGEYFTRMDSDDISLPERFEKQINFLEKNKKYGICSVNISEIDEDDIDLVDKLYLNNNIPFEWQFIWTNPVANAPCMFRIDIIKKNKLSFNKNLIVAEDYDFISRVVLNTRIFQINEVLYKYRIHKKSAFFKNKNLALKNSIEISKNYIKSLVGLEPPDFYNFFTVFTEGDKRKPEYKVDIIYKWFKKILFCSKKRWNWNFDDYALAINDAEFRIKKYLLETKNYNTDKDIFFKQFNILRNLHVGDNDLIGNKFNGHDLHKYMRSIGIDSTHLVWNKESNDENTYLIAGEKKYRESVKTNSFDIQEKYYLNCIDNPITYDILYNKLFLYSDVVHFHLIHNYLLDIQLLPIICKIKPIVWSLHDPWTLGGHCVHHYECDKWKKHCGDCDYINSHFEIGKDNSALIFEIKKQAFQNSNFDVIVPSKWLKDKVDQSPFFKGKNIHFIPYGIDHEIFKPANKDFVKNNFGINEKSIVILFRCDYSEFKGMDYIEYVLNNIKTNKEIFLLIIANEYKNKKIIKFKYKEFGWVKNDVLLSKIYNASDLFLAPSKGETFGMMAAEAMSCGVLPIVLDGTALPDTVNAPNCGVTVKRNKEEYLKTVQYYIDHDIERNEKAKKCLEFARKQYNKENYVNKISEVYKKAIEKHNISDEGKYLINQLKKHMMVEPTNYIENSDNTYEGKISFLKKILRKTLSNKQRLKLKSFVYNAFYIVDKIVPKIIRFKVKNRLNNNNFVKKYLIK